MRFTGLLLLLLAAGVSASESSAAQRHENHQRGSSRNRPPAEACPPQAVGLIRKASANAKIMSDIDKTCGKDRNLPWVLCALSGCDCLKAL